MTAIWERPGFTMLNVSALKDHKPRYVVVRDLRHRQSEQVRYVEMAKWLTAKKLAAVKPRLGATESRRYLRSIAEIREAEREAQEFWREEDRRIDFYSSLSNEWAHDKAQVEAPWYRRVARLLGW